MSLIDKTLQEVVLDRVSTRLALFFGVKSAPIVYSSNPFKEVSVDKGSLSYPFVWLKFRSQGRNTDLAYKKEVNHKQFGPLREDGSRIALNLMSIIINMDFEYITNDPKIASRMIGRLLFAKESYAKNNVLSFSVNNSKLKGLNFGVQIYLENEEYDLQEVEYAEDAPMEYKIQGALKIYTKGTEGCIDPEYLPSFFVPEQDAADDYDAITHSGESIPLTVRTDGQRQPIRLRANIVNELKRLKGDK